MPHGRRHGRGRAVAGHLGGVGTWRGAREAGFPRGVCGHIPRGFPYLRAPFRAPSSLHPVTLCHSPGRIAARTTSIGTPRFAAQRAAAHRPVRRMRERMVCGVSCCMMSLQWPDPWPGPCKMHAEGGVATPNRLHPTPRRVRLACRRRHPHRPTVPGSPRSSRRPFRICGVLPAQPLTYPPTIPGSPPPFSRGTVRTMP